MNKQNNKRQHQASWLKYVSGKDYEQKIYYIDDNAHPQRFLLNLCIRL